MLEAPVGATIEVRERRDNYAKFVIEPLERGFGITLGNALRRVLLSSIPGAAVTYMKIDGVLHEFSTIPGMVEDTIALMLNLKGLPVKLNSDEPKVLTLSVSGARDVTAATSSPMPMSRFSIQTTASPRLSSKDAKLTMEIGVEKRTRLRDGRPPAQRRAHDRPDSARFALLADPQGELYGRRYARRAERRLRPADGRNRDERLDHARRSALEGGLDHAGAARPLRLVHESRGASA